MGKTILVAGAGHGGLAVAADLARKGYDVTVLEQKAEQDLGYDWTDIFAPDSLIAAGVPYPSRSLYSYKENMTFFPPSCGVALTQHVPEKELEIKMERRDIYAHLIAHAKRCGVQFRFETPVTAPLLLGSRVCGVYAGEEKLYADLVIDACGLHSVLRSALPEFCGVESEPHAGEIAYVYRAFYERTGDFTPEHPYEVYVLHRGQPEVAWVATEENFADVLIVRFTPFGTDVVEEVLSALREKNPHIGEQIVRGGQFAQIPVRQPLSMMVADGYAAIGDAAFMTVPLIGSGIANALKASHILSRAITDDKACAFTAETLWKYQVGYYKLLGTGFAAMTCLKNAMLTLDPREVDFLFERGILTEDEITITATTTNLQSMLSMSVKDLVSRAKKLCTDKILLTKILRIASQIASATALCAMMPKTYSAQNVRKWVASYNAFYSKSKKG